MAIVSTYSVGASYSGISLSTEYSTIDELLTGLVDNSSSLIKASNVRDAVYTLWERVDQIGASVSLSGTNSVLYNRTSPSLTSVGGISIGSTFSGTIQDTLDRIFYPYTSPTSILGPTLSLEYGDPSGYNFTLNWSVVKNSNTITSIIVDGAPQIPTGNSQSGTKSTTGTHSSTPPVYTTQTYNMSVSDGVSSTNSSTTLTLSNRIFWGRINLSSIGNPNLTTNPGSYSVVSSLVTSTILKNLNGAGANGIAEVSGNGSQLSTSKSKTYTNINGNGEYLIFAWPSNVSGSTSPTFNVGGLASSAFTKVKTNWPFVNQFNFSGTDYEVWVSNTIQNSPLTIVIN